MNINAMWSLARILIALTPCLMVWGTTHTNPNPSTVKRGGPVMQKILVSCLVPCLVFLVACGSGETIGEDDVVLESPDAGAEPAPAKPAPDAAAPTPSCTGLVPECLNTAGDPLPDGLACTVDGAPGSCSTGRCCS